MYARPKTKPQLFFPIKPLLVPITTLTLEVCVRLKTTYVIWHHTPCYIECSAIYTDNKHVINKQIIPIIGLY